jgi:hypothetical protein
LLGGLQHIRGPLNGTSARIQARLSRVACRARAAPPALRLRSQRLSVCWLPAPPLRAPSWAHAACSVPRQLGEFPALRRQPAACSAARRRASRHNDAAALRCRATRRMRARSTPSGPIPCSLTLIVAFSSPLRSANAVNVTSRAAPWFPGTDAPAHLTGELAGDEVAFPDQHQRTRLTATLCGARISERGVHTACGKQSACAEAVQRPRGPQAALRTGGCISAGDNIASAAAQLRPAAPLQHLPPASYTLHPAALGKPAQPAPRSPVWRVCA